MIDFVVGALFGAACAWRWVVWQTKRPATGERLAERLAQAEIRAIQLRSLRLMGEAARCRLGANREEQ